MSLFLHRSGMLSGYPGFFLDQYPGAAAAYSLRVLSSSFASADIIRVRRSSDNAELDFTAAEITNGTLTTWTGANDGFVVTWYDQSGNSRNATQATAGKQPKIVSGGSLILEGSNPTLDFDGTDDALVTPSIALTPAFTYVYPVRIDVATGQDQYIISENFDGISLFSGTGVMAVFNGANLLYSGTAYVDQFLLRFEYFDTSTSSQVFRNGNLDATGNAGTASPSGAFSLGGRNNGADRLFNGKLPEVIIYDSDQRSNRTGIEANIADAWGITLP